MLAIMLTGRPMWKDAHPGIDETFRWMRDSGGVRALIADWGLDLGEQAQDMLAGLLQVDPAQRMTMQQAMMHPFLSPPEE